MVFAQVVDPDVRRAVRVLYGGAGVLFLFTVALGIANAAMDQITRAQVLSHFHSGTIGWVTLSVVATTLWAFEGNPGRAYRGFATVLAWLALIVVAGYIAAFGLAFGTEAYWLLPLFGIPTGLVVYSGLGIALVRARQAAPFTTPHLLLIGALTLAAFGATMGILVGLNYFEPAFPDVHVGAHAGPMDMYLLLAFAAIVETLLVPAARTRWPGIVQMALGTLSGLLTGVALLLDALQLAPVAFLLFLTAFAFYVTRVGWRTVLRAKDSPALFWGGLSLPVYVVLFTVLVFRYFIPDEPLPHALEVTFLHVTFVGAATNLVVAIQAAHLGATDRFLHFGVWTMNLGLLAFIAGELAAGRADGAYLMALGVVLVLWRLIPAMWRAAWERM